MGRNEREMRVWNNGGLIMRGICEYEILVA